MGEVARELIDFECRFRKSSAYRWVLANPPNDPRDEFRSSRVGSIAQPAPAMSVFTLPVDYKLPSRESFYELDREIRSLLPFHPSLLSLYAERRGF